MNDNSSDLFGIEVDEISSSTFLVIGKWVRYFAILGCIATFFSTIFAVALIWELNRPGSYGRQGDTFFLFVFLLGGIAGGIYPIATSFKFLNSIKLAISSQDKTHFNAAIGHLKKTIVYLGILTILGIGLFIIAILWGIFLGMTH